MQIDGSPGKGYTIPMKRTARVRPEIGSGGDGHTFPGATYPFGLVQPSPDTGREGYRYCSQHRNQSAAAKKPADKPESARPVEKKAAK